MTFHSEETAGSIHIINEYVYADETAREAATGFVAGDVGKVAKQSDNASYWILTTTAPTWMSITGGGVDEAPIDGSGYVRKDGAWAQESGGLGYPLQWGGNMQTTGRFAQVSGVTSGGQETGLSAGSEWIVPANGTLDLLTYNTDTGNATTVFKIWKNGAVEHTFTATGAGDIESGIGLAVVAGDLIAIEYDAGMRPAGSVYMAYID